MSEVSPSCDLKDEDCDALLKMESELDVNAKNYNRDTWLIVSRTPLLTNVVSSLMLNIDQGSNNGQVLNINQTNYDGQTALMVAAGMGHADIVQLLIDHKGMENVDVNARDIDDNTALHYAVTSGSSKCVALLLEVPGIEIDNSLESYIRGKEWRDIEKIVQDSRATLWKKTEDFENLVFGACNGDLCKLPEPCEPDHVQVKKSMDLIKSMSFTETEMFSLGNGKMDDVKWLEYPEQVVFNTINSLLAFYQTDLGHLNQKVDSNNPPNLQYFLNIKLVDLLKNPGSMIPTICEGESFNAKKILESMTYSERAKLINGLANKSDISPQGAKFYLDGVNRALGVHLRVSVKEFQSQFEFCRSVDNYQDAYDLNEIHWEEISTHATRNGANCCPTKLLDRDGDEINLVTTFGGYITRKHEALCVLGRLEEAKQICLKTLKNLEEKTIRMQNGKEIKLSQKEVKAEFDLVTEHIYVCLSNMSVIELDFEKGFEILDRNVLEGLEFRLDALNICHETLQKLMIERDCIAKQSLGEDIENSRIIVNPILENHYIDENGKFHVQSLDKALRIAKNGDAIFLKNGKHDLTVSVLEKNVTIIGESTNESFLNVSFHKRTLGEVQFKRLHIEINSILLSKGKLSFESCLVEHRLGDCQATKKQTNKVVESCCETFFTFDNKQAEIDLHLCCFASFKLDTLSSLIQLKNSDSSIKINMRKCSFTNFDVIIGDFREKSLRCGFELNMECCSIKGLKLAMITLHLFKESEEGIRSLFKMLDLGYFTPSQKVLISQKEVALTYPTSVVIRNCFVEVCNSWPFDMSHIVDIDNASHILIESTKFNLKRDPNHKRYNKRTNPGLHFANTKRVEIANIVVIREGTDGTLACFETYLEKQPNEGCLDDAAIQLTAVHEATIRDSMLSGFYNGITTQSRPDYVNRFDKICFTGVYNCQVASMAVCVLLDSRFTGRSIFVVSDMLLRDSLVGVRMSESCCRNGSVDVLDTSFINIASPIVVPKVRKKDVKDASKNLLIPLETKNLKFPDGGPQNCSRKKRRDNVIQNLVKAGVLESTASMPYLENIFNPQGDSLEIADEKDLEPFNLEDSRPHSSSDYQSDNDDSVD